MALPFTTLIHLTADGTVLATGSVGRLHSIVFSPALALSDVELKTGGPGGTLLLKMVAAAGVLSGGTSTVWRSGADAGALFSDGIYVNLTGVDAEVTVEWSID